MTPTPTETPQFSYTVTYSPTITPSPTITFTATISMTPTVTSSPACGGCLSPQVTYGTGVAGSGNGQLNGNTQMAVGTIGATEYVYFADINNGRIVQFNAATGAFSANFYGVDAVKDPSGLQAPYGTALSQDGRYLIAASTNGNKIVKMDLQNGGAVSAVIAMNHPLYVSLDPAANGDLYVSTDASVTRFHEQTPNQYVTVGTIGTGVVGSGPSQFHGAESVLAQGNGNTVYVSDMANQRIMKWVTSNGGATYSFAATVFTAAYQPYQLVMDPSNPNLLYVGTGSGGYAIVDMSTAPMWTQVYECDPEGQGSIYGVEVDANMVYVAESFKNKGASFPKPPAYCLTPVTSATFTPTNTSTRTPTSTSTVTPTWTGGTFTPTRTPTFTLTDTPTATPTFTMTPSPTETSTLSITPTLTITTTPTLSLTPTPTLVPTRLDGIYPNPCKNGGTTNIFLNLAGSGNIRVRVWTVAYRKIADWNYYAWTSGLSSFSLPLNDQWGNPLSNGLYYLVVDKPDGRAIFKMIVIK
jgi:hypothetical protein